MDMNELKGRVLKVNLARPMKTAALNPQSNRASASYSHLIIRLLLRYLNTHFFSFDSYFNSISDDVLLHSSLGVGRMAKRTREAFISIWR